MTHRRVTSLAAAVALLALAAVHPQSPQLPSGVSDKTATVFGSKIRYLEAGSGPAVVLLHGLGGDSSHWAPTIGALSQKFRVIVPDQIGFGRSDKPFLNYRVGTLVDFLDGLFRELKLERASLVGSSLGGWTAAAFALAHPEKVARLALVGSAGFALAPDFDPRALNALNPSTLEGARALLSSVFYNREPFASAAAAEQLLTRHATAGDGYAIQRFLESIARREDVLDDRLSALKAPTLILWGREDALTPLALAERFKREIPGSELVVIDKCGHVPQLEKPAESNAALLGFLGGSARPGAALRQAPGDRPNVLWILGDDLGPNLACYGEPLVRTPNIDRLAGQGARFRYAFTTAPVCSPSRSALMTGMYQTTIGAHQHRSHREDGYRLPPGIKTITELFRERGYFTANVKKIAPGLTVAGKTDFNFNVDRPFDGDNWGELKLHQPFFAEVNFFEPHRNWAGARNEANLVDPAKVVMPPYYPDHPVARDDYAHYLDAIQLLDRKVGVVLRRLEEDGLAENTIVFFFGDNGQCHVRGKQWLYDAGLHIPLIVRWPGTIQPGTVRDDLVSAIDISATSLRLAGVELPASMQGQVFLGPEARKRNYIFGARDRCDETVDRIRSVHTRRYNYIRNFHPELPYTQPNAYKERSYPVLALMKQLHAEGKLTPAQELFMAPRKPVEELYDLESDPHEIHNLAASPKHQGILKELRAVMERRMKECNDREEIPGEPR